MDRAARQLRYAALFKTEIDPVQLKEIRAAANGGFALGSERFKSEIAEALGRSVVPATGGRPANTGDASR